MASLKKRGKSFVIQYYVGGKQKRKTLGPIPLQIAKEQLRQFESAQLRGIDNPLPTQTPIAKVLDAYVEHIRHVKTPKSAQTDVYYLREMFGPICPAVQITSRRVTENCRKCPLRSKADRRCSVQRVEASCFEAISTAAVAGFISSHTRIRDLKPKTANRYREIIVRVFNWAMQEYGIRMPGNKNPAAPVGRYRQRAPEIRFLTLPQIDEQLNAIADQPQLQAMVATLIYAGLRREELLWLQHVDVDLGRGLLQVRAKTVNGLAWQPKTRKNRCVPISKALREYLDNHAPQPSSGNWYFPSPKRLLWDSDGFSRKIRRANVAAGLHWSCLDYCRTFGSLIAQSGVSLYQVSVLMGNRPEICRRHYAALIPQTLTECVSFGVTSQIADGTHGQS